jgi:hypothetical protein
MRGVREALSAASTPEEIGACLQPLEAVIICLRAIRSAGQAPPLAGELEELRFEMGVVGRLIVGGGAFYQGWGRTLAAAENGYTPSGDPPALQAPGSVSLMA